MEHLHRYRTHIYVFVGALAIVTAGIAFFSYKYNPTEADIRTTASTTAVAGNVATWKGVNFVLQLHPLPGVAFVLRQNHFDAAAQAGANVIRLQVGTVPTGTNTVPKSGQFFDSNGNLIPAATSPGMAEIQTALAMAAKDNLKVIINIFSSPGTTNGAIWTSQADWDQLSQEWAMIAAAVKGNPTVLGFDLMNEPDVLLSFDSTTAATMSKAMGNGSWTVPTDWAGTPRDYNGELAKVIAAVRAVDPSRTVIVEGFGQSGGIPRNFIWSTPIPGASNVVYSFHMYLPYTLTTIGGPTFTGVPMPFVYPTDEDYITNNFSVVSAFQKKYNVPIYIGEFGLYTDAIFDSDPSTNVPYNGACWLSSLLQSADTNHWGWTFFDLSYNGFANGYAPVSSTDPRYVLISNDMKQGTVPDACTTPLSSDSTLNLNSLVPAADALPPTVTLNGSAAMTLTVGDTFADPGATAKDAVGDNMTESIVPYGTVNTAAAGTYTINYTVKDSEDNTAKVSRIVTVKAPVLGGPLGSGGPPPPSSPDTTPPTITLLGSTTLSLNAGTAFSDPGATATDNVDGNLTSAITTSGSVDTDTAGTYTITYSVTDKAGNTASATRTVIVIALPVITGGGSGSGTTTTDDGGSTTGDGGVVLSTPTGSNIVQTVSQPISAPVSNTISFTAAASPTSVPATTPVVTTPKSTATVTAKTGTAAPTGSKTTSGNTASTSSKTVTSAPTVSSGSTTITPAIVDPYKNDPAVEALRQKIISLSPSTTVTSIDYSLDGSLMHTSTVLPDTWNLDTTTVANGVDNLTIVYHYQNGSTQSSITIFEVKNGQTIIESVTGVLGQIWQALVADLKKL